MMIRVPINKRIAISIVVIGLCSGQMQAWAEWQTPALQAPPVQPASAPAQASSTQASQPGTSPAAQQIPTPAPVGTAAAPEMKSEGTPASAPAGAAIAPAKQRRVKSFSVRVALLVGAAVAVGVVAGAALASPSSSH